MLPLATIVLLLLWMGFFMLGSLQLPLLILRHDTPLDARFIRGRFDVYSSARPRRPAAPPAASPPRTGAGATGSGAPADR